MKKKILSIALVLCLLLCGALPAAADSDQVEFDPHFTSVLNKADSLSGSGWNSSDYSRSLLVVSLIVDISASGFGTDRYDVLSGAIIAHDGLSYYVIISCTEDTHILASYIPLLDSARYSVSSGSLTSSNMKSMATYLTDNSDQGKWTYLSGSDLLEALVDLREILND